MEKILQRIFAALWGTRKYSISAQTLNITETTTLMPEKKYGGWVCVNTGTNTASVLGYELQPGEGLNFKDAVPAGSSWDTPIQIVINSGAVVRITRLQAKAEAIK